MEKPNLVAQALSSASHTLNANDNRHPVLAHKQPYLSAKEDIDP
ncbi:hypothetical protein M2336_002946 [Sphingobium sp. B1D7B]|nr:MULTISPECIES: hypothetical protein [unclassified Sphingobium]MCW2366728.1 hypothetical protein [Sphingobium sp. B7D2B]MCW2387726.1 hypothetical protein [Sphingobium sp. B11D3B]MCW2391108.1 hypothetical protein [Sphingobium sp. B11D3A]MCW2406317.1 hypothetical protein [Sphingobium sp. B1D7B]MCW2411863.1 hypothetical protein [Sphingobium sp. B8D3D]